jgi:hypothetical protein
LALLLPACQRPSEQTPRSDVEPAKVYLEASLSADRTADAEAIEGTPSSSHVAVPAPPVQRLDAGQWLRDHGVARWDHDSVCWARWPRLPEADAWHNACGCEQGLTLMAQPPVDLLVCTRSLETPVPSVPWITHAVVYVADHGRLRAVLDAPVAAATDDDRDVPSPESSHADGGWEMLGTVALGIRAEGAILSIFDRVSSAHPCGEATFFAARRGWGDVQKAYGSVCASIGHWTWNGTSLVRVQASR